MTMQKCGFVKRILFLIGVGLTVVGLGLYLNGGAVRPVLAAPPLDQPFWIPAGDSITPPVRFEQLSLEQGLSQSSVTAILQDRQGFMWFSTQEGLNRYDGYEFKNYRHDPDDPHSLSENQVIGMVQDQEGKIWIVTDGPGFDQFDPATGWFTHYSTIPYPMATIYLDREGFIWLGTNGGGLFRFDPMTQTYQHYHREVSNPNSLGQDMVRAVFEDRQGMLWIGFDGGGLDRLDRAAKKFTHYRHNDDDPYSLSHDAVLAILEDLDGNFWIGTDGGGVNLMDRNTGRFLHYQHNSLNPYSLSSDNIRVIYEDRAGRLWIGTEGGGLECFDLLREQFAHYQHRPGDPHSLSNDTVLSIFEDREGGLWIGTITGGLSKWDHTATAFQHYQALPNESNSLSENTVWSILEDRSEVLWIGTNNGVDRLDRSMGKWEHFHHNPYNPDSLALNYVRAMVQDRRGFLWIGMDDGLIDRFDPWTRHFVHYRISFSNTLQLRDAAVFDLLLDANDNLWVASGNGLYIFERKSESFIPYQSASCLDCFDLRGIRTLYQDRDGKIWLGVAGVGLRVLDPSTGNVAEYPARPADPTALSHHTVLSINQDSAGVMWIGTSGGLNRFNSETGTFTRFTEKEGLPNNMIYGILNDESGNLWLSTNGGLSRFDPKALTFTNYDVNDGLQSNEFNAGVCFKNEKGELFFGGINGFNVFFPEAVKLGNSYVPPVILTELTQNGEPLVTEQPVENLSVVTLRWPQTMFEFEFTALSFVQPGKNQYAYRLENFDRDWNWIGTRRFGRYTNLPGGTYTLWIKGSNNSGIWNERGTAIKIVVEPPFWSTWWFRGVAILALIGGVFISYRLRVRDVEARSRELEVQVAQRTAALQQEIEHRLRAEAALRQSELDRVVAAERSRLARDLHDVVTQTLFSASLVAEALPTAWSRDPAEGNELLQELRQLTRGALAEMRTLLLELRPSALIEADLGNLLRQLGEALTGREGTPVTVTVDGPVMLPPEVHLAIYRIAQESLNNISKHACARTVTLQVSHLPAEGREGVALHIRDDGCGFDASQITSERLGLKIMRERADSIGAQLTIDSQPGAGTDVVLVWQP